MSVSMHAVLVELVELSGETDEPVSQSALAASLAVSEESLAESLDSLQQFELVAPSGDGYRPTVTARELLAADIQLDDTLVLDIVDS